MRDFTQGTYRLYSWDAPVDIAIRLLAGKSGVRFPVNPNNFLPSRTSRSALALIQPSVWRPHAVLSLWINRPGAFNWQLPLLVPTK